MMPPLAEWESFYVIIGSSAAALTGLQFVVIALLAESRAAGGEPELRAFATPTVVHFSAVLLIAAILSTPRQTAASLSVCLSICGAAGLLYAIWVVIQTRRQQGYAPVLEDWIWHAALPVLAYACLFVAGVTLRWHPGSALYVVAATALLLLYIGIHNAWDSAIWMSIKRKESTSGASFASEGGNRVDRGWSDMKNNFIARASTTVNAPIAKVWDALVNPRVIKQYMFGTNVTSDWKEGSPIVWKGEWQGKAYADKGTILKLEPGHFLQYSHFSPLSGQPDAPENYHTVTIELSRQGTQTSVSLSQDNNATSEGRDHSEKNWRMMLGGLKKLLETAGS